jgi:hypothetical protein
MNDVFWDFVTCNTGSDVSEKASRPSQKVLRLIDFRSCITVETPINLRTYEDEHDTLSKSSVLN